MTDIVDILKNYADRYKKQPNVAASLRTAADEIIRLRAENERLNKRDHIVSSNRNSFM